MTFVKVLNVLSIVHVCGDDLVILRDDSQLLLIRDYKVTIQSKKPLSPFIVVIKILDPKTSVPLVRAVYMAFEHGRVAVVTVSTLLCSPSTCTDQNLTDCWFVRLHHRRDVSQSGLPTPFNGTHWHGQSIFHYASALPTGYTMLQGRFTR